MFNRMKSLRMLENMLPSPYHVEQLIKGKLILDELKDVTLLYSDMKGFTPLSAKMHPKYVSFKIFININRKLILILISPLDFDIRDLMSLLNIMYSSFEKHLEHFGLYKIGIS